MKIFLLTVEWPKLSGGWAIGIAGIYSTSTNVEEAQNRYPYPDSVLTITPLTVDMDLWTTHPQMGSPWKKREE